VTYSGLVLAGVYQINVTVPDVEAGDQPVVAKVNGAADAGRRWSWLWQLPVSVPGRPPDAPMTRQRTALARGRDCQGAVAQFPKVSGPAPL